MFQPDGSNIPPRTGPLGVETTCDGQDDDSNGVIDDVDATAIPRGLFVLSGDGQLARIDELEPPPAEIALWHESLGRTMGRFAVAPRP